MTLRRRALWPVLFAGGSSCESEKAVTRDMKPLAEDYTKLILSIGSHDESYVDAYYGPAAWKPQSKAPLEQIAAKCQALIEAIEKAAPAAGADEIEALRHRYLLTQTRSAAAYVAMLGGKRYSFDEESRALYDAVAPRPSPGQFDGTIAALAKLVPGAGPLAQRFPAWRKQFQIPAAKLDTVFAAAIAEARARTREHIALPANENFRVEYVKGQVWSAYNWYKGDAQSLIQVNTDLPVEANFALRLACHEGYPGHHVYNALLEDRLVRKRGWPEYSVYPLYSPQSLIAEGSADYGLEIAFPGASRAEFLAKRLFPLAGLDAGKVPEYLEAVRLADSLDHAVNEAARRYLDREINAAECQEYLRKYALQSPDRAAQRVRFIDKNRSYVINYNVGEDLVAVHMRARGAAGSGPEAWREFEALLSSPRLPSGLARA